MKLDSTVVELLELDPETVTLSSAGGGGCSSASTFKIVARTAKEDEMTFFMKTGHGEQAKVMFEGVTTHDP